MKLFLLAFLLSISISAKSDEWFEDWSVASKSRQASFLTLLAIDWRQTYFLIDHPNQYKEQNIFLGDHPSKKQLDRYMVISAILHTLVISAVPEKWRAPLQYISIAVESEYVYHNYKIGLRLEF